MPENKTETTADDGKITTQELIRICGISEPELTKLSREGILVRTGGKRNGRHCILFDWRDNFARYAAYLKAPSLQARDDWIFEKRMTQQVVRAQKELELAYARGDMVKRSRVQSYVMNLLMGFKNKLLGIPARIARQLVGQTDIHKVRRILDEACRLALVDLATFDPNLFDEPAKNGQKGQVPQSLKQRVAGRRQ